MSDENDSRGWKSNGKKFFKRRNNFYSKEEDSSSEEDSDESDNEEMLFFGIEDQGQLSIEESESDTKVDYEGELISASMLSWPWSSILKNSISSLSLSSESSYQDIFFC